MRACTAACLRASVRQLSGRAHTLTRLRWGLLHRLWRATSSLALSCTPPRMSASAVASANSDSFSSSRATPITRLTCSAHARGSVLCNLHTLLLLLLWLQRHARTQRACTQAARPRARLPASCPPLPPHHALQGTSPWQWCPTAAPAPPGGGARPRTARPCVRVCAALQAQQHPRSYMLPAQGQQRLGCVVFRVVTHGRADPGTNAGSGSAHLNRALPSPSAALPVQMPPP